MQIKPLYDRVVVKPFEEQEIKKGDRILYGKYSGTEVTVNGEEFLIMRESDIFAIINK